jgi:hypothetical protein
MRTHKFATLLATTVALTLPATASAVDTPLEPLGADTPATIAAGSCTHPTGDVGRAAVAYRWTSRSNAWRVRPAFERVPTTSRPGGGTSNGRLAQTTEHTGIQAWYLVLDARQIGARCYLQVRLPAAPRLRSGWVDRNDVLAQRLVWQLEVDLSDRRVRMYRNERLVLNRRVVIGDSATPTPPSPAGQPFAMYDAKAGDADDFTGTWQLATTEHSAVDEGLGRIGIHGRGGASLSDPLGASASNGCVRAENATVDAIVRKAGLNGLLGVPVVITR